MVRIETAADRSPTVGSPHKIGSRIRITNAECRNERVDISVKVRTLKDKGRNSRGRYALAEICFDRCPQQCRTISMDTPGTDVKYDLKWTASRPRYVADYLG